MTVPTDRRYGPTHEWYLLEDDLLVLGVTEQGQELLGDVVFAQLPEVGSKVERGQACATLESVKAASDVICPVDGVVIAVNAALSDSPELINDDPFDTGWILHIRPSGDPDEWMSAEDYQAQFD
ncbi:MAG: glycine cleavage system protein GcvH [Halothiobacillus sp.]|nr:glycine cleavage system protein GcvH [Halothiobacillus sp.]